MGRVKGKSAFDHVQIHIILNLRKVKPGPLLSINTHCSIQ